MEEEKEVYMCGILEKMKKVKLGDVEMDITMTWADGMIGVMPVFDSIESARKYDGKSEITVFKKQSQKVK